jgi:uncharacterized protein YjbJ (UPF0337 family)
MGEWKDKAEGTVKETVGKATGDQSMQNEGEAQDTWGHVQGAANNVKDKVGSAANRTAQDMEDATDDDAPNG